MNHAFDLSIGVLYVLHAVMTFLQERGSDGVIRGRVAGWLRQICLYCQMRCPVMSRLMRTRGRLPSPVASAAV